MFRKSAAACNWASYSDILIIFHTQFLQRAWALDTLATSGETHSFTDDNSKIMPGNFVKIQMRKELSQKSTGVGNLFQLLISRPTDTNYFPNQVRAWSSQKHFIDLRNLIFPQQSSNSSWQSLFYGAGHVGLEFILWLFYTHMTCSSIQ